MDEFVQNVDFSGVETADAAGQQMEGVEITSEPADEVYQSAEGTGVETDTPVAGEQKTTEKQGFDERVEQAFAKRLAAATQKYEEKLRKFQELTGYDLDEALSYYEQRALEEQRRRYEEAGLDPDLIMELINQHPTVQQAAQLLQQQQEQTRIQAEVQEFLQEFPDIKPEDIPQEVWQYKFERGVSLLDAYLRVNYKQLAEKIRREAEQAAIAKITGRDKATTGPTKGAPGPTKTNIWELSSADFEKLVEKAKRGELREL